MLTLQYLFEMIRETNIDLALWGNGNAKTATHLLIEENQQECTLELINGVLYRNISVVSIAIYHHSKKCLHLQEKNQIFTNGNRRIRNLSDQCSIAEKIKRNETPLEAAIRAISAEELRIPIDTNQLQFIRTDERINLSSSYPGIISRKIIHIFECLFTEEQFNLEGYTEIQEDKISHFHWVTIPTQPV